MSPVTRERLQLNVMIEGQEGLTWERWQRLARAAEESGYGGLYRSVVLFVVVAIVAQRTSCSRGSARAR